MTNNKATTIKFNYAGTQIEGLLMPNGEYRISVSQTARLLNVATPNHATKQVKRILGKDSPLPQKVASDLNSNKVNTITLEQFGDVVFYAATENKNPTARAILKASTQTTITQAFEVALGIEKNNIQLVEEFQALVESKRQRLSATDSWKKCYELTGQTPAYGTHTMKLYQKLELWDKYLAWKEEYGANNKDYTFRHHYLSKDDRLRITDAERIIQFLITKMGKTIDEAIDML